jgi:hypothetical protein
MTIEKAKELVGGCPEWELIAMRKALSNSVASFFNTDEDNERLEAIKIMLKELKK